MLITLRVKDKKAKFFIDLIKHFDFVEVDEYEGDSKEEILASISKGLEDLKDFEDGKTELIDARSLVDEL